MPIYTLMTMMFGCWRSPQTNAELYKGFFIVKTRGMLNVLMMIWQDVW